MNLNNTARTAMRRNASGLLRLTALMLLMRSAILQATSFNCDRAMTSVEKLICSNTELSNLDEILNAAYRRALIIDLNERELKKPNKNGL